LKKRETNSSMKAAEDLLIRQGWDLKDVEDYRGAVRVLEGLIHQYPDSRLGHLILGYFYYSLLNAPRKALPHLRIAVRLGPKSEKASRGLFHCLWDMNRLDEALEEIKRFQLLTNWSCKDYREIVAEINEKWTDDEPVKPKRKSAKKSLTKSHP
jgi:tetratricopeptide (TPR) repeat protein